MSACLTHGSELYIHANCLSMTRSMTFWAVFQKSSPYSLLWGAEKTRPTPI